MIRDQFVKNIFAQEYNFTNDILSSVVKNNVDNVIKLVYYKTGLPDDSPYTIDTEFLKRFFYNDDEIRKIGQEQHSTLIDEFMKHIKLIKRGKNIERGDFSNVELLKLVENYSYLKV